MGCFMTKSVKEAVLQEKENQLMVRNFSISQIKEAFFDLKQDEISIEGIMQGFKFLKIQISDTQKTTIFLPFLRAFIKQTISVSDDHDYNFKDLMAIFFLLSKCSTENEKAVCIFRLYDQGHEGFLRPNEIYYVLKKLMGNVYEYSRELLKKNDELRNQIKEMEKQIKFDKRVGEVIDKCQLAFHLEENQKISEEMFYEKLSLLKANFGFDFLSTKGIRQILDDNVNPQIPQSNKESQPLIDLKKKTDDE